MEGKIRIEVKCNMFNVLFMLLIMLSYLHANYSVLDVLLIYILHPKIGAEAYNRSLKLE